LIYFDHAATTPIDPSVLSVMKEINRSCFANPSSIHSSGQKSKVLIEKSRKKVTHPLIPSLMHKGGEMGRVTFFRLCG
jgi:cysteine desulfurase